MANYDRTRTKIILEDLVRTRLHKGTPREVAARHGCSHQYVHKVMSWLPHRPEDKPYDPKARQLALAKVTEDEIVAICNDFIIEKMNRTQICEKYQLNSTTLNEIFYTVTDAFHTQTNIDETNMIPALEAWRQTSNLSVQGFAEKIGDKFYNLQFMRRGMRDIPASTADAVKDLTGIPYSQLYAEFFNASGNDAARFFLKQALAKDDDSEDLLGAFAWAYMQANLKEEENGENSEE